MTSAEPRRASLAHSYLSAPREGKMIAHQLRFPQTKFTSFFALEVSRRAEQTSRAVGGGNGLAEFGGLINYSNQMFSLGRR